MTFNYTIPQKWRTYVENGSAPAEVRLVIAQLPANVEYLDLEGAGGMFLMEYLRQVPLAKVAERVFAMP
ncbi:MAG: hypothetical protein KAX19_11055 [Candidatus Brocadiae bacterium]|nr:hypothetical protein [Candidatus Brocadiia bacterium]